MYIFAFLPVKIAVEMICADINHFSAVKTLKFLLDELSEQKIAWSFKIRTELRNL